jgi:hypothetical protein
MNGRLSTFLPSPEGEVGTKLRVRGCGVKYSALSSSFIPVGSKTDKLTVFS